jgi:hypothetical protein
MHELFSGGPALRDEPDLVLPDTGHVGRMPFDAAESRNGLQDGRRGVRLPAGV